MSIIYAYKGRGLTKDIVILNAAGTTIVPAAADIVRVTIGRIGETAKLTVTSDAATVNGSSITKGATNRLRLDASDLSFSPGTYTMLVELVDSVDGTEPKNVDRQTFVLEET